MARDPGTEAKTLAPHRAAELASASTSIDTEFAQLRIRVIALENLVIALLAQSPKRQLALACEMATHISPRPGFTAHRLTLHAAGEMLSLVGRAKRFRSKPTMPITRDDSA